RIRLRSLGRLPVVVSHVRRPSLQPAIGRLLMSHSYALFRAPANPATCLLTGSRTEFHSRASARASVQSAYDTRKSASCFTIAARHSDSRGMSAVPKVVLPYSLKIRRDVTAYGGSR